MKLIAINLSYNYKTPLIFHFWDWDYGQNTENVGILENTEKYKFTLCKILNYIFDCI